MKGLMQFVGFLFVATAWVAVEFLARHKQSILFTLGLAAIVIGLALERTSLAFIAFGVIVCGLLVLGRLIAIRVALQQREGKQDA